MVLGQGKLYITKSTGAGVLIYNRVTESKGFYFIRYLIGVTEMRLDKLEQIKKGITIKNDYGH